MSAYISSFTAARNGDNRDHDMDKDTAVSPSVIYPSVIYLKREREREKE